MRTITLEELLEAGCHFGHQVTRQNPKARDYVFEARDGIHIIDLEKTKEGLEESAAFIKEVARKNGTLLVLGTKRQAEPVLKEVVARLKTEGVEGVYFVTRRWMGGTLTNLSEISKNFKKLKELNRKLGDEDAKAGYTKKEVLDWEKDKQKLFNFYGGVVDMLKLPDALFVIDTHLENLAVQEAIKMKVKVAGITDTNADPTIVDFPIPANDDAVGSLKLICDYIFDAWIEGRKLAIKEAAKVAADIAKADAELLEKAKSESNSAVAKSNSAGAQSNPVKAVAPKVADAKPKAKSDLAGQAVAKGTKKSEETKVVKKAVKSSVKKEEVEKKAVA